MPLSEIGWLLTANRNQLTKELLAVPWHGTPMQETRAKSLAGAFIEQRENHSRTFLQTLTAFGKLEETLSEKAKQKGIPVIALSEETILSEMPLVNPGQAMQFRLAEWFAAYYRARDLNEYHRYRVKEKGDRSVNYLTEERFIEKYGPEPWTLINSILERARLPYRVNHPAGISEAQFTLHLFDPARHGLKLQIGDLSSGERIILSIVLLLYQTEADTRLAAVPKLLLLDEADAPLHPSFTSLLVEILNGTLVKKFGLRVIMATHSPSTVALAPTDSVYELRREPREMIPTTPAQATQVLSAGFVSVMPADIVVITESGTDRDYYQKIHDALVRQKQLSPNPSLKFISASADENDSQGGGCAQVQQWAPKLSDLGLVRFKGLIDRDAQTRSNNVVKVIKRFSVENYILDPLTLIALLIRAGIEKPFSKIPIENRNIYDLPKLRVEETQRLVVEICGFLEQDAPELRKRGPDSFVSSYVGMPELELPSWVRDARGHRSEADAFGIQHEIMGTLNNHAKKEGRSLIFTGGLQSAIEMQSDVLPEIIPGDLRDTMKELKAI